MEWNLQRCGTTLLSSGNTILLWLKTLIYIDRNVEDQNKPMWTYNLYTDVWKKYAVCDQKQFPTYLVEAFGAVVQGNIYVHAFAHALALKNNRNSHDLWKLKILISNGRFRWSAVPQKDGTLGQSPREGQSGWDYRGELWIFGGFGPKSNHFLNENGHYNAGCNNRLLGFNFVRREWKNPNCFGTIPSRWRNMATTRRGNMVWLFGGRNMANTRRGNMVWLFGGHNMATTRRGNMVWLFGGRNMATTRRGNMVWLFGGRNMATTRRGNMVWLFGGHNMDNFFHGLFQLDMCTFTWTQIQTGHPKPKERCFFSLTAVLDNRLVLHGGTNCRFRQNSDYYTFKDTWVLGEASQSWTQYKSDENEFRSSHTGTSSISNNVIIVGGVTKKYEEHCQHHLHVMLEPKSLQQLAMTLLYHHRRSFLGKSVFPRNSLIWCTKSGHDAAVPSQTEASLEKVSS